MARKPETNTLISLRLPPATLKRLDALAKRMERDPDATVHGEKISRSDAIRAVVAEGLDTLERRYNRG